MAKLGKFLLFTAAVGAAVAGGLALLNKKNSNEDDFDEDYDFDDDFDDDDFDMTDYDEEDTSEAPAVKVNVNIDTDSELLDDEPDAQKPTEGATISSTVPEDTVTESDE